MNLTTQYMTRNDCYTAGKKIVPKGIMVHSTAAPGVMAAAWFARWNKSYKAHEINRQACVHAFVDDKGVWQYLPWNHRGWHAGGSANDTHIGFEICEPAGFKYVLGVMVGYNDRAQEAYFRKAWQSAVDLCVMLCREYGLYETNIICHSEGHKKGLASNHGDVMHWFPKHGESMDTFRAAVRKALSEAQPDPKSINEEPLYRVRKSWSDAKSQIGAFTSFEHAKDCAATNPGFSVYDSDGKCVYTDGKPAYITYTVVDGDMLWGIAQKLLGSGTRYIDIMALNDMQSDTINTGQKLKIPK